MNTPQCDQNQGSLLLVLAMALILILPIKGFSVPDPPPPPSVSVTLGTNTIWWFNGEHPTGYEITTIATAWGIPEGIGHSWSIVGPASITGSGTNVTITSTAPSSAMGDVILKLIVNGVEACETSLTVRAPDHQTHQTNVDSASGIGWTSGIYYKLYDQFNDVLPHGVHWE